MWASKWRAIDNNQIFHNTYKPDNLSKPDGIVTIAIGDNKEVCRFLSRETEPYCYWWSLEKTLDARCLVDRSLFQRHTWSVYLSACLSALAFWFALRIITRTGIFLRPHKPCQRSSAHLRVPIFRPGTQHPCLSLWLAQGESCAESKSLYFRTLLPEVSILMWGCSLWRILDRWDGRDTQLLLRKTSCSGGFSLLVI